MGWWLEMEQVCFDLSKLFWWLDLIGFFMAGLGALLILASVALTGAIKNSDVFEADDDVNQYIFEIKASKPWLRKFVWWLIGKGNFVFLLISSSGFLLQIPEKIFK